MFLLRQEIKYDMGINGWSHRANNYTAIFPKLYILDLIYLLHYHDCNLSVSLIIQNGELVNIIDCYQPVISLGEKKKAELFPLSQ